MRTLLLEVNGEAREVPEPNDLRSLIEHLSLSPERLAIELNGKVVRRADWPDTLLKNGDRIEVVHFVGGGSRVRIMLHDF